VATAQGTRTGAPEIVFAHLSLTLAWITTEGARINFLCLNWKGRFDSPSPFNEMAVRDLESSNLQTESAKPIMSLSSPVAGINSSDPSRTARRPAPRHIPGLPHMPVLMELACISSINVHVVRRHSVDHSHGQSSADRLLRWSIRLPNWNAWECYKFTDPQSSSPSSFSLSTRLAPSAPGFFHHSS